MVRSRQLAVPARAGAVRLTVTSVERERGADGAVQLLALHGLNAGRSWCLTMADALAAAGTGRYVFEVTVEGKRHRADVLGTDGALRLHAPSPVHGDLIEALPDWNAHPEADVGAAQQGDTHAVVATAPPA